MERDFAKRFGKRLRDLREAKALTQLQVAALLLKSIETISNFERGKTLPGLLTVEKLASVLGVQLPELFAFDAPPPLPEPNADAARVTNRMAQLSESDRALVVEFVDLIYRHKHTP